MVPGADGARCSVAWWLLHKGQRRPWTLLTSGAVDASSLRELLITETLPWARWPVRGQGEDVRAIEVRDLQANLAQQGVGIERAVLDDLVRQGGGRREGMVDPWPVPRRAIGWMRGGGWKSNDVYVFPSRLFEPETRETT